MAKRFNGKAFCDCGTSMVEASWDFERKNEQGNAQPVWECGNCFAKRDRAERARRQEGDPLTPAMQRFVDRVKQVPSVRDIKINDAGTFLSVRFEFGATDGWNQGTAWAFIHERGRVSRGMVGTVGISHDIKDARSFWSFVNICNTEGN